MFALAACTGGSSSDTTTSTNGGDTGGNTGGGDTNPPPDGSTPQIETACADQSSAYSAPAPFTYADTVALSVPSVTTSLQTGIASLSVTLPVPAVALGIVAQGSNAGPKFIDHGILLQPAACIATPLGNAPLSFNRIDFDRPPDGVLEDDPSSLLNYQAPAVVFPNNGTALTLPAGTYGFSLGALDATFTYLLYDTFQPRVYYKVPSSKQTTLRLNLYVASGVSSSLVTAADAQADAEIQGAIQVLRNVYESDPDTAIKLEIAVGTVPASYVTLTSPTQADQLASGYPTPATHDAINLFVVGTIALPGTPIGEVGEALGLPGPFNRQGTVVSGVLVEYQGDHTGTVLGFALAHELGHYLGLFHTSQTDDTLNAIIGHDPIADTDVCTTAQLTAQGDIANCPDRHNLMFPYLEENATPAVTPQQGAVVRLDPAVQVKRWRPVAALAHATCCMGSTVVNNQLYLLGGQQSGPEPGTFQEKGIVTAYDPAANTWASSLATMPSARSGFVAAAVNGVIYAIGGTQAVVTPSTLVEAYTPGSDTWSSTALSPLPTARSGATGGVVNGVIYVVGGKDASLAPLAAVEAYDPATDTWSSKTDMPTARYDLTVSVAGGKLYAIGGSSAGLSDSFSALATVEVYDPTTNAWSSKADMPTARVRPMSSTVSGKILVVGGVGGDASGQQTLDTAELYDPATDTWTAHTALSVPRASGAIGTISNHVIVAGGGNATADQLTSAEIFDGTVEP